MNPLEAYLKELSEIRSSGAAVRGTSCYGPLANLLNEIGKTLKPRVKCIIRDKPILVILGNPPYNSFSGGSPKEAQGLVDPYKEGLFYKWNSKKFNLGGLCIRFSRLAGRRIAEESGKGVICSIQMNRRPMQERGNWPLLCAWCAIRDRRVAQLPRFPRTKDC
jgi:hypothetical protein